MPGDTGLGGHKPQQHFAGGLGTTRHVCEGHIRDSVPWKHPLLDHFMDFAKEQNSPGQCTQLGNLSPRSYDRNVHRQVYDFSSTGHAQLCERKHVCPRSTYPCMRSQNFTIIRAKRGITPSNSASQQNKHLSCYGNVSDVQQDCKQGKHIKRDSARMLWQSIPTKETLRYAYCTHQRNIPRTSKNSARDVLSRARSSVPAPSPAVPVLIDRTHSSQRSKCTGDAPTRNSRSDCVAQMLSCRTMLRLTTSLGTSD